MPFKKGQSGNPIGRKLGASNIVTRELRERVKELVESRFDDLARNLDQLEPKEQIVVLIKLMEFVLPKGVEVKEPPPMQTNFDNLSIEEMELLLALMEKAAGEPPALQTTNKNNGHAV